MNRKLSLWGLLIVGAVALTACAAPAGGNSGMTQAAPSPAATMAKAMPTEDKMMVTATPMAEKMEDKAMMTPPAEKMEDAAMATPEKMMDDQAAMSGWLAAGLTDVITGETFAVADLKGQVVLVETMAIWCPTCLRQQREMLKLKELLGPRDDFATVTLDVDLNEEADALKAYAAKHGFGGRYAVAGATVARELATLYGDQFINPPSAPMLVIDRLGVAHPLPFGVKDAATLQAALAQFLAEGM